MSANYASLCQISASLTRRGQFPLTPKWQTTFERFYGGTQRQLVIRAGRGSIKSTSAALFALNEVLFGDWHVPPGERHYFVFISLDKDEASSRLAWCTRALSDLGFAHDRANELITLRDRPLGLKVCAPSVRDVSGPRAIGFAFDELAKAWSKEENANPAKEVAASARAMCVTHQSARFMLCSSPLSTVDYHYDLVEKGSDRYQLVEQGPTWAWNPSISEEQTHRLEPDDRVWRREYLAIPQASRLAAFDDDAIDRAFRPRATGPSYERSPRVLVLDPSSGRKDAWTWAVVGWDADDLGSYVRFDMIDAVTGRFWQQVSGDKIVEKLVAVAQANGVSEVHADQRESLMLQAAFEAAGLRYVVHDWGNTNKTIAVETVRRWLRDGSLALPDHDGMRKELRSFEEKVLPSGSLSFGARGSGHDDFVALLLTAAMVDAKGSLPRPGSSNDYAPSGRTRERNWAAGLGSRRDGLGRRT